MRTLIIIPARFGSKGVPRKNIKLLGDKPLIEYTFDFANRIADYSKDLICLSTDDTDVIEIAKKHERIQVPFIRPEELSSDSASSFEVITHALEYYYSQQVVFENILLLQPTSPFRTISDFNKMYDIFLNSSSDMVVTVKKSKENPYFSLFEESNEGFLKRVKSKGSYKTRQESPNVYVYNGSMYLLKVNAFLKCNNFDFGKIIKYEMPEERSVDIDNPIDWVVAEFYLRFQNENE